MMTNLFVIYDLKAEQNIQHFASGNCETAKRELSTLVNNGDPNNLVGCYPEDYVLYHIGYIEMAFNPSTSGLVYGFDYPVEVCNLSALKRSEKHAEIPHTL